MRTLALVVLALLGFDACVGDNSDNRIPAPQQDCIALDDCHVAGVYDANLEECTNPQAPDGKSCIIGTNTCFAGSTCAQGHCTGGALLADGTACDDHNACTMGETCSGGTCEGGSAVTCTQDTVAVCYATTTCDPNNGCPTHNGPCDTDLPAPMKLAGCPFSDYYGNVTVGNQTFTVTMDSGSSTLAVAGGNCKSCVNESITPLYKPSSTAVDQHTTGYSVYGDQSNWRGEIFKDTVSLAASPNAVSMRFASITTDDDFFRPGTCVNIESDNVNYVQGIMGLGGAKNLITGTDAWVVNMGQQGNSTQAYSVELCENGGKMWMGGYNPNSIGAPVNFASIVANSRYFAVTMNDISLGGQSLGLTPSSFGPTVVDTGTSLMLVPQAAWTKITQALRANSAVTSAFDANKLLDPNNLYCLNTLNGASAATLDSTLPRFTMSFPNRIGGNFSVDAPATSSYLFPMDDGQGGTCFLFMLNPLEGLGSSIGTILGNTMMRTSLVVFDNTNGAVGFTPQVDGYCGTTNFDLRSPQRPTRHDTPIARIPHRGRGPHRPIAP